VEKIGIKRLRSLKTEALEHQPFPLCSDGKPVALIVPTGDLTEQEIVTPKVTTKEPHQVKTQVETQVKIPRVKIPVPLA